MLFLIFLSAFIVVWVSVAFGLSAPGHAGPVSSHFNGRKFINPSDIQASGLRALVKWMLTRKRGKWVAHRDVVMGPKPVGTSRRLRITFINHSTFLIQVDDFNILTDPIWSERASPFSWAGPRRMRPPGIRFEDLPRIDAVLLSHNHYDHLDIASVIRLKNAFDPRFIVPLGVAAYLKKKGIQNVHENDWWTENDFLGDMRLQCVPAVHFSGRGGFDRDRTLWCGYVIKSARQHIYFAGDTGYHEAVFNDIGNACHVDVAIIPIGAYMPRWFMSPIHCSPDQAVQIHIDVKARKSIASHFGTFPLADEAQHEPVQDLHAALAENNLTPSSFLALKEGVPIDLE